MKAERSAPQKAGNSRNRLRRVYRHQQIPSGETLLRSRRPRFSDVAPDSTSVLYQLWCRDKIASHASQMHVLGHRRAALLQRGRLCTREPTNVNDEEMNAFGNKYFSDFVQWKHAYIYFHCILKEAFKRHTLHILESFVRGVCSQWFDVTWCFVLVYFFKMSSTKPVDACKLSAFVLMVKFFYGL